MHHSLELLGLVDAMEKQASLSAQDNGQLKYNQPQEPERYGLSLYKINPNANPAERVQGIELNNKLLQSYENELDRGKSDAELQHHTDMAKLKRIMSDGSSFNLPETKRNAYLAISGYHDHVRPADIEYNSRRQALADMSEWNRYVYKPGTPEFNQARQISEIHPRFSKNWFGSLDDDTNFAARYADKDLVKNLKK